MTEEQDRRRTDRRPRRRGRGPRDRDRDRGAGAPRPSAATAPLTQERRLDLDRAADAPLDPAELSEATAHIAFLRRFKGALRLALNAQEDLLVNGARPPTDRGQLKHLLGKIDRTLVERALSREALLNDPAQRVAFLAGVVRLIPDPDLLLSYLESLSRVADRREAAQVFALTVERLDFAKLSVKQAAQILSVLARTFQGHDRVQALFGLLDNASFRAIAPRAMEGELAELFRPLTAVHRVVIEGRPLQEEEDDPRLLTKGLELLLSAPEPVLKSQPEAVRARLAEQAIRTLGVAAKDSVRRLIASLPVKDPAYQSLRLLRTEQLLAARELDEARSLLNSILNASPGLAWAERRKAALSWRSIGPLLIGPALDKTRLHRALWLERAAFVLVRIGPPTAAGQITAEARAQSELAIPLVAPVLMHGLGDEGTVFVALPPLGRPLLIDANRSTAARIRTALFAAQILQQLARAGYVLPDLDPQRFVEERGAIVLADLEGIRSEDESRASLTHGPLAAELARKILGPIAASDRPRTLRGRLPESLALLQRALAEALTAVEES
ncbi:MAG: hypothetical protein IT384_20005 [Deltaproteobacteria bacterium]|nr:hypothetical protein [Deltaproteobacteria bacterium]